VPQFRNAATCAKSENWLVWLSMVTRERTQQDCLLIYRPATREGVHLVTCGHFRSCDIDDGHTIRSAVHGSILYRTGVITD